MKLTTCEMKINQFWCVVHKPPPSAHPSPFLLFLHGAGERGDTSGSDLKKVLLHGPWRSPGVERFFVVAPQCPTGQTWPSLASEVVALTRALFRRYQNIDQLSSTVTGLSMGGFGAWAAAVHSPGLFSAVVSVCGGFAPPMARGTPLRDVVALARRESLPAREVAAVKETRAWLFHGTDDKRVSPKGSRALYRSLGGRRRGRKSLRLTLYAGAGHSCWGRAYRTEDLLEWASPAPKRRRA